MNPVEMRLRIMTAEQLRTEALRLMGALALEKKETERLTGAIRAALEALDGWGNPHVGKEDRTDGAWRALDGVLPED